MSGILAGAGVLLAAGASAVAILLPPGRIRSTAMLVAIALFPILILGDQWHSHQIVDLRDHPSRIVALAVAGLVVTAALATAFRRWRAWSMSSRRARRSALWKMTMTHH